MSKSKSALWISCIPAVCLIFAGSIFGQDRNAEIAIASDSASKHSRPLTPPPPTILERIPLTNPDLGYLIPTPARVLAVQNGFWVTEGSDLYKLSKRGDIQNHLVYPYTYTGALSIPFWDAMALHTDGKFYVLLTDAEAQNKGTSSLLLLDKDGSILQQWKMKHSLYSAQMISTNDGIFINSSSSGHDILILSHDGQFKHLIGFSGQSTSGLVGLWQDSIGQIWVGAGGIGYSIESRIFQIDSEGQVGAAYGLRPQFSYPMPEEFGSLQDMVALPDGGIIVAVLIAYFNPNNPQDQRWKIFTYLAEIGGDGAAQWGQLYQDLYLISLKRDETGGLWSEGYTLVQGNLAEKALLLRFSSQGVFEWALERAESSCYNAMLNDQIAVTPDGGLAMAWTRQCYDQELWFGLLDTSPRLVGCDTIFPSDIGSRWIGPVGIDVSSIAVNPLEQAPVDIWEETIVLWDGTGEVIDQCPLGIAPQIRECKAHMLPLKCITP